ncbi:hypothetical protein DMUE_1466 [Dictyocoela muelleri]|nr:hypothetical protein DMUE_1466 [Dictyocoela muelleri]
MLCEIENFIIDKIKQASVQPIELLRDHHTPKNFVDKCTKNQHIKNKTQGHSNKKNYNIHKSRSHYTHECHKYKNMKAYKLNNKMRDEEKKTFAINLPKYNPKTIELPVYIDNKTLMGLLIQTLRKIIYQTDLCTI